MLLLTIFVNRFMFSLSLNLVVCGLHACLHITHYCSCKCLWFYLYGMAVYVVFNSLFALLQPAVLRVQNQAAPSVAQHVQTYPPASSETPAQPAGQTPVSGLSTPQPLALLQGILTAPQAMNPQQLASSSQTAELNTQAHVSHQPAFVPQSATAPSYHPATAELANAHTFPPVQHTAVAAIPSKSEAALHADQSFQSGASSVQHVSSTPQQAPALHLLPQPPANATTDRQLHDFSNMQQTAPVHLSQAGSAPSFQQVDLFQPYLPNVCVLYVCTNVSDSVYTLVMIRDTFSLVCLVCIG